MERDPSGTEYGQYWQPEAQQPEGYAQPAPPQAQAYDQSAGYGYPPAYPEQPYPEQAYQDPQYQAQQYAAYPEQQQYQGYYQPSADYTGYQQAEYQPTEYQYGVPAQQGYDATAQWSSTEMYQAEQYPAPEAQPQAQPPVEPEPPAEPDPATGPEPEPAGEDPLLPRLAAAATGRAPGTDRRSFLLRAGVGLLALIVVAVAGYAVAGQGGTKKPAAGAGSQANLSGTHSKAWSAPAVPASAGNDGLLGSWLLPDALVRGDGTAVTAYDTAKGGKLWTVVPPSPGAVPCAMSPTVSSTGVGAVLFQAKAGTGQACTQLVAVDTATGKQKWTATINKATKAYSASVMVNDTRAVAVGDAAAVGYDLGTGKQSWTYAGPGKFCGALGGSGVASTLLLQSTCADTNPKQQAINLNADTGKLVWWRGLPQTAASYTVLSAVPAVVAVHMTAAGKDTIMSFSAKGDTQASIPVTQPAGLLDSTHGAFDPDPALFFQDSTMIAEITPGGAASGTAGLLTAFNLVDGKQLWQATPLEKGRSALVGIDSTAAVVATEERIGQQARLSHFDLTTGKESSGGNFPRGTGSLLTSGRILYRGSLVAVLPEFTNPYGSSATVFNATG
ncbi:PQQ-binding-like beta-propeller repeat protein [Streptacidiphilus sp. N1-12]|uniref:PQQ-binding-like beta-propeller repeat protein n=2 Tax=Streptacidiphilus alkalitolerans TaxID=3342712 RepID=A0ABV6WSK9_9ACTN